MKVKTMDQIKQFLAVAKKHHFWILSGVTLLMGLGGWFYATSQINADKAKEIAEIKSKEQAARAIVSEQNHPNRQYVEGMDRFVSLYRADVEQAWQRKRDAQQKDLAWPGELNVSGTDFTDAIDALLRGRPIEAVPDEDLRLPVRLRERYRDYIKEELPKLAERVGAKWAPQGGGTRGGAAGYGGGEGYGGYEETPSYTGGMEYEGLGGAGRGRGPLREKPPLVIWNPSNQGAIQADSFDWTSRDNNTPTTKEVLYAQENLWVLENLMDIIARTNGAITEPHQATIKRIDSIEFGREVLPISSKVARVRKASSGTGMEGMDSMDSYSMESEGSDPEMMGGEMGSGLEGGVDPSLLDPAHRRYVDKDYKKLTADDLKSAMASPSAEQYYLAVAKRLPVRMKLQMDQRKLDKLLVECGNANLMVEVRQVRVNGKATTGRGGAGGYGGDDYGGGGGYDTGAGGGYEDEMGGGAEMYGAGRGARGKTDADEKIFEVPVEIYGIIYIYNPVNKELLGVEEGDLSEDEGLEEGLSETAALPGTRR